MTRATLLSATRKTTKYLLSSTKSFFFSSRRRHTRCLSDWSSDVCSSDLCLEDNERRVKSGELKEDDKVTRPLAWLAEIGRASCRERVWMAVGAVPLIKIIGRVWRGRGRTERQEMRVSRD